MSLDQDIESSLKEIRQCAYQDYIGARILWNLGVFSPSIHLMHESLEKYLKVLWASRREFTSRKKMEKELRGFGHDVEEIVKSLHATDRIRIENLLDLHKPSLLHITSVRYKIDASIRYGDSQFRAVELLVSEIRRQIGEKVSVTLEAELISGTFSVGKKQDNLRLAIVRNIVKLKRHNPTKVEVRKYKDLFTTTMNQWYV